MGQGVAGNGYFSRLFVCLFVCLFICLFAISPFGKQRAHVYNILYTHSKVVQCTPYTVRINIVAAGRI